MTYCLATIFTFFFFPPYSVFPHYVGLPQNVVFFHSLLSSVNACYPLLSHTLFIPFHAIHPSLIICLPLLFRPFTCILTILLVMIYYPSYFQSLSTFKLPFITQLDYWEETLKYGLLWVKRKGKRAKIKSTLTRRLMKMILMTMNNNIVVLVTDNNFKRLYL